MAARARRLPPTSYAQGRKQARGLDEANQALGLGDDPHILRASPIHHLLGSFATGVLFNADPGVGAVGSDLRV